MDYRLVQMILFFIVIPNIGSLLKFKTWILRDHNLKVASRVDEQFSYTIFFHRLY